MGLYGIGQAVPREEDPRLLKGRGKYVDDVKLSGEARAYVLRSPHAHAKLGKISVESAKKAAGVLAVLTGVELKARGLGAPRLAIETDSLAFVRAMLTRLQPTSDEDWRNEPDLLQAHLDRLARFAGRLSPVHNTLKALVLHHRLQLDLRRGKIGRAHV